MLRSRSLGGFALRRAILAGPVKDDFVILDTKSSRGHFLDAIQAGFEIENLAARPAQKMMMVTLVGPLIPGGLARNFDRHDLPVFRERLQRPIDRGDPNGGHLLQGELQNLSRGERVCVIAENGLDGPLLPGVSVHAGH